MHLVRSCSEGTICACLNDNFDIEKYYAAKMPRTSLNLMSALMSHFTVNKENKSCFAD